MKFLGANLGPFPFPSRAARCSVPRRPVPARAVFLCQSPATACQPLRPPPLPLPSLVLTLPLTFPSPSPFLRTPVQLVLAPSLFTLRFTLPFHHSLSPLHFKLSFHFLFSPLHFTVPSTPPSSYIANVLLSPLFFCLL